MRGGSAGASVSRCRPVPPRTTMPRGVGGTRDPRSVEWDPAVRAMMIRAIRAMRNGKGVLVWVASPRHQFREKDGGGRTAEERAFTRAAYWQVWGLPRKTGTPMHYSLKLTWGQLVPSSHGRRARAVQVRLFPRGTNKGPGRAERRGTSWVQEVRASGDTSFQAPRTGAIGRPKPPPR